LTHNFLCHYIKPDPNKFFSRLKDGGAGNSGSDPSARGEKKNTQLAHSIDEEGGHP